MIMQDDSMKSIGCCAVLAAASVVTKNVPYATLVEGNLVRIIQENIYCKPKSMDAK